MHAFDLWRTGRFGGPGGRSAAHEESGIWAAIAYSSLDRKHGFFLDREARNCERPDL
ncbi:hypothetical protein MPLSOD_80219 [Mesorhizobium sp. SOD10]|nr:hypothetical protein MPLSOD_80219 [Mesorhizobium sp. SOD10]